MTDTRFNQFKQLIAAWTRKDAEAVLAMLHDDVVWHYAAAIAPPARGKAEARAFIERFGSTIERSTGAFSRMPRPPTGCSSRESTNM